MTEQRLFAGMVMALMATILAWALVPSGLPATKTIGSAFSPATSTVVLRTQARQAEALPEAAMPEGLAAGPPLAAIGKAWAILAIVFVLAAWRRRSHTPSFSHRAAALPAARPRGTARPRAPPSSR